MMFTKNAAGNLINKYKAVLANCRLMNAFGALALAAVLGMPSAALANEVGKTVNQATPWVSSENITVTGNSGFIIGIQGTGTTNNVTLQSAHTMTITAEGNNAYGMYGENDTDNNTFTNLGTMNITSKSIAYGMYTDGYKTNRTFSNSGTITVTVEGGIEAYGMEGSGNNGTSTFTNSGTMTVTAEDSSAAYGMDGFGSASTNTFINSGTMTVKTKSNTSTSKSYGMRGDGDNSTNNFTNSGPMTVTAEGNGKAHGMYGDGDNSANTFINSGAMTVTAGGNSEAYGMRGNGANNTVTNSGTMTVTAGSKAYGMRGDGGNSNFTNSGTMNVTAGSEAHGMWVSGGTSTLNNTGTIYVSGGMAYQAFVDGGTANIGTWALKLEESYAPSYSVFGVEGGAKLNFGVGGKGATFIITDKTVDGTLYAVKDLVDNFSGSTAVTGYIAEAKSKYDFVQWNIVEQDGTAYIFDSNPLWSEQYIKGEVTATADNSPAHAAANHSIGGMKSNMSQMRNIVEGQTRGAGARLGKQGTQTEAQSPTATMYADAGTSFTDASFVPDASYLRPAAPVWKTFLTPYYSQNGANNGSYDGHMYGVAMGATCQITDDFALGAHFGLSKGSSDSALTDTDATSYTLGAHAVYNVGESLFFRGQLSGFMAENDLTMLGSSAGLTRANTDMDTTGIYAMLGAGYDIALNDKHILTPELGLSYFYAHMDGFDADFYDTVSGSKDASLGMASESYDVWYTDATLRWTGIFDMDKGTLRPTLKAGIRQALSDPDVSSTMRFGTVSATTHSDANETAFLCEAGFSWEYDAITLSATYSGELGDEEHTHTGMFKVEWSF